MEVQKYFYLYNAHGDVTALIDEKGVYATSSLSRLDKILSTNVISKRDAYSVGMSPDKISSLQVEFNLIQNGLSLAQMNNIYNQQRDEAFRQLLGYSLILTTMNPGNMYENNVPSDDDYVVMANGEKRYTKSILYEPWQYSVGGYEGASNTAIDINKLNSKPLYRVMSESELNAVKDTGYLRGGREGTTYFTDSYYKNASNAQNRLSLPNEPEYIVEFKITNNPTVTGGNTVKPAYGGSGGGREYFSENPVQIDIINYQKMK